MGEMPASDVGTIKEDHISGINANPYNYKAEYTDQSTGHTFLRARYADTETGTFLTEDEYAGSPLDPTSQNRYTFAENDPVNYADPSGHGLLKSFVKKVAKGVRKAAKTIRNVARGAVKVTKGLAKSAISRLKKRVSRTKAALKKGATAARKVAKIGARIAKGLAKKAIDDTKAKGSGIYNAAKEKIANGCAKAANLAKTVISTFRPATQSRNIGINSKKSTISQQNQKYLINQSAKESQYYLQACVEGYSKKERFLCETREKVLRITDKLEMPLFVINHSYEAFSIGGVIKQKNVTNISTNATRFANAFDFNENVNKNQRGMGSEVNAVRHTIWMATITSRYGVLVGLQAGSAHESDKSVVRRVSKRV